jgi:hypothetical protein
MYSFLRTIVPKEGGEDSHSGVCDYCLLKRDRPSLSVEATKGLTA